MPGDPDAEEWNMFNPLLASACLASPSRLTGVSAWTHHIPFAFALVEAVRPRLFVELGTHAGDSYCAFCQAVKELGLAAECFAVDTWEGDEHSDHYGPEVLEELRRFHDPRYGAFSRLLQTRFDLARAYFEDGSIDLLHIDGFHTYEAVRHDFETWLPAMSKRGVVLLHDTQVRERDFGVWKLWEELQPRYPHFELPHCHGLGVLGVGDELPADFHRMVLAARETASFGQLFDLLGTRVDQTLMLSQYGSEMLRQRGQIEELTVALANREEETRRQAEELKLQAALLRSQSRQLAYFAQWRFRLADRADRMLSSTGPLYRWMHRQRAGQSSTHP